MKARVSLVCASVALALILSAGLSHAASEKFKGQILKRLAFRIWYEIEQQAERIRKSQERRMRREAREAQRRR